MKQKQDRADKIGLEYTRLLLERKGCKVIIPNAKKPGGLIEVSSAEGTNKSTVELKTIVDEAPTGTIGVLVGRNINGRTIPAGAMVSPADYHVFVIAGDSGLYGIETPKLRQLIQDQKYNTIEVVDDGLYTMAVFSKKLLLENCEHVQRPPKLLEPMQHVKPVPRIKSVKSVGPSKKSKSTY